MVKQVCVTCTSLVFGCVQDQCNLHTKGAGVGGVAVAVAGKISNRKV